MSDERLARVLSKMTPGTMGGQSRVASLPGGSQSADRVADAASATAPVTTSSAHNGHDFGGSSLTLNYPGGAAGDVLLIWLSLDTATTPTLSGDLDLADQMTIVVSTGRLRVYRRVRLAGDISATWTVSARAHAVAANIPAGRDGDAPTTDPSPTPPVVPAADPDGPGLLAIWWSFSEIDLNPYATLLEDPYTGEDVTTGFELRLYQIGAATNIVETAPTNPSFPLVLRAASYTTVPS